MTSIVVASLAVAGLALGLGACGATEKKLSRAELARQANVICLDTAKRLQAIARPAPGNVASTVAFYDKAAPLLSDAVARLDALRPADDVKRDWDAYIAKQAAVTKLPGDIARQVQTRNATAVRLSVAKLSRLTADADGAARKVGATACATSR